MREGGEGMDASKGRGGGVLWGVGALGSSLKNGLAYKPPSLNTHNHYCSDMMLRATFVLDYRVRLTKKPISFSETPSFMSTSKRTGAFLFMRTNTLQKKVPCNNQTPEPIGK